MYAVGMRHAGQEVLNRSWLQLIDVRSNYWSGLIMRTTLALDDDLIKKAQSFTGPIGPTELVREALKALIERESAKRLARLGGSDPDAVAAPRRRTKVK
jgi:Arc/MetJ family transcription regulator